MVFIGHKDQDDGRIQPLKDHLTKVGELAEAFAEIFHEGEWGKLIGDFHDIGKYSKEFQCYIENGGGKKVDHSTAGMQEVLKKRLVPAAFCIAGHHGGLPDGGTRNDTPSGKSFYAKMNRKNIPNYQDYMLENEKLRIPVQSDLLKELNDARKPQFALMIYIRMLFSCLVDADFLDTEKFMNDGKVDRTGFDSVAVLAERLSKYIDKYFSHPQSDINRKRCEILQRCAAAGRKNAGGICKLTVPTGGGKTIASLAFALQQAKVYGKRRVIYIIPYTSIIEQNAEVFGNILGKENIVEHHMNVEYDDTPSEEMNRKRLATENWDAPVIVTTNVQFFESLFSNKTSRCRKLHNISSSVLIFDEAQMLPLDYLLPCVKAIEELSKHYGCTTVLCSATQPSLDKFFDCSVNEIGADISEEYQFFQRTSVQVLGKIEKTELAERINKQSQVLCIVNTKKEAQELYKQIRENGTYHLSTYLYPAHRTRIIAMIKKRLDDGLPCRVISTSLIEAGVDLDFPTVYRELAGLDSIIQAAGRCNREGRRSKEESLVYVYETADTKKNRNMRQERELTQKVCREMNEISTPAAIKQYFDYLHKIKDEALDKEKILARLVGEDKVSFPFAQTAKDFVLIKEVTKPLIIPIEKEAQELVQRLRNGERSRMLMRKVGKYIVNIYSNPVDKRGQMFEQMYRENKIEILDEEINLLADSALYDENLGLVYKAEPGKGVWF